MIACDGFNEVALPPEENVPKGVFPFFPRTWYFLAGPQTDPEVRRAVGEIGDTRERRQRWAKAILRAPWRWSTIANLVWKRADDHFMMVEFDRKKSLQQYRPSSAIHALSGPPWSPRDEDEAFEEFAATWRRSSRQMAALCRENGIEYFHFLQPNQYVPGSKPMGAEERAVAVIPGAPYSRAAERGYPFLRRAGEHLTRDDGVRFRDLTAVFAGIDEPLYVDSCCHVSARGYEMVADAIGETVVRELSGTSRGEAASQRGAEPVAPAPR